MRTILIICLFIKISAPGQDRFINEKEKIYGLVAERFIDKNDFVVNETFISIQKTDIDANYKSFFDASFICAEPARFENSVTGYLQSKDIAFDTTTVFRQIDAFKIDSIEKYQPSLQLVSFKKAPIFKRYFFSQYFKKKSVTVFSNILFDEKNKIAIVKLDVFTRNRKASENTSRIVILQNADQQWNILGVLHMLPGQ